MKFSFGLSTGLLLKRLRKGGIYLYMWVCPSYRAGLSLRAAILTEINLTENLPQLNSRFFDQHDVNNVCNLSRLIWKKVGFTPVLANHKKGMFPLKRAFLGASQRPVRRISNEISSFRLETYFFTYMKLTFMLHHRIYGFLST